MSSGWVMFHCIQKRLSAFPLEVLAGNRITLYNIENRFSGSEEMVSNGSECWLRDQGCLRASPCLINYILHLTG